MRGCSTKVVIRGIQIKTMRYCYTSTRIVKIKRADHSKFLQGYGATESHTVHSKVKWYNHLVTISSSHSSSRYLPKRKESIYAYKDLYINVQRRFYF